MGCTTCGGQSAYGPSAVIPTPRQPMPGADGLVLVEWQGEDTLTINTADRQYVFSEKRRRLYMTTSDYAATAAHVDGVVVVELAFP